MEKENAFFFKRPDGSRLFGIFHPAQISVHEQISSPVILYCNPIFEEHQCSHRISVNFARYAAKCGYSVLRFDYFGDGESDGLFEDASVSSRISDIQSAFNYLKNTMLLSQVYLVGLRFGATLGILTAEREPSIAGIVAWSPIINVYDYLYALLRSNLTTQLALHKKVLYNRDSLVEQILNGNTVNVDGYEIGKLFFEEAREINLSKKKIDFCNRVLAIQISLSTPTDTILADFITLNGPSLISFVSVKEVKFWMPLDTVYPKCDSLFETTLNWIKCSANLQYISR